jgi:Lrp/AsnC family transcriptional regulator of ectoine degradation
VPEILECYALGGGIDYFLSIVTVDLNAYQRLMEELLDKDIGIAQYFSYVVTKEIRKQHGYPILDLAGESPD